MGEYSFWVSGLNVVDQANISRLSRFGWGTEATSKFSRDIGGWFHLAIPTPTQIDNDDRVELRYAFIYVKGEGGYGSEGKARISQVDLWDGPLFLDSYKEGQLKRSYDKQGKEWIEIKLSEKEINFGLVISMLTHFPMALGVKMTFYGAGVRLDE
ncbi:MAG: hypothetical protein KO316_08840 [Methanobacterium sp.]|jgi:hypothetical protein|nr:hypothetical protein [Methanobacterium sp.]